MTYQDKYSQARVFPKPSINPATGTIVWSYEAILQALGEDAITTTGAGFASAQEAVRAGGASLWQLARALDEVSAYDVDLDGELDLSESTESADAASSTESAETAETAENAGSTEPAAAPAATS